jgi:hypothetical protein
VDIGAGGGYVFYYSSTAFTSTGSTCNTNCHYLESAPTTGSSKWVDVIRTWATNTNSNQTTAVSGADETRIGSGYQNSLDIVAQTGNVAATSAAVAAREYRGPNSLSDWFLPSKDELHQLFLARSNTSLGLGLGTVWSSSESSGTTAWHQDFYWTPSQSTTLKNTVSYNVGYVRPVRAG